MNTLDFLQEYEDEVITFQKITIDKINCKIYYDVKISKISYKNMCNLLNFFDKIMMITIDKYTYYYEDDINCYSSNDNYYTVDELYNLLKEVVKYKTSTIELNGHINF